jgi:hypothetical protein
MQVSRQAGKLNTKETERAVPEQQKTGFYRTAYELTPRLTGGLTHQAWAPLETKHLNAGRS